MLFGHSNGVQAGNASKGQGELMELRRTKMLRLVSIFADCLESIQKLLD